MSITRNYEEDGRSENMINNSIEEESNWYRKELN